jgi:hypothetical protein
MEPPVLVDFGHGRTVVPIAVDRPEDTAPAVEALGLGAPRPILVVVGGAAAGATADGSIEVTDIRTDLGVAVQTDTAQPLESVSFGAPTAY